MIVLIFGCTCCSKQLAGIGGVGNFGCMISVRGHGRNGVIIYCGGGLRDRCSHSKLFYSELVPDPDIRNDTFQQMSKHVKLINYFIPFFLLAIFCAPLHLLHPWQVKN